MEQNTEEIAGDKNLTRERDQSGMILDFLEDGLVLFDAHGHEFVASIILIEDIAGLLFQFFHVGSIVNTVHNRAENDALDDGRRG